MNLDEIMSKNKNLFNIFKNKKGKIDKNTEFENEVNKQTYAQRSLIHQNHMFILGKL